ncbi:Os04g0624650 [Oryza sativa Japonica Group]|uniref:Os04g0624650 protein n=1 Tax=Oryza sativa subsp. japonica TaxID=39947 RepID=A0A0P0WF04_ORYSJ|nr:hypothetical protein EE612_025660 [Oryza sativa]BAS91099.1 Os04g0624650 [Oryza sativa Japonica Group]
MVQFHIVQSRSVPCPILLHHPLAEGVEPIASIIPCGDRPVKGVIHTVAVSSFETEPVWLKTLFSSSILIIVDVKNGMTTHLQFSELLG